MPTPSSQSQGNQETIKEMCIQDAKIWILGIAFAGAAYWGMSKPAAEEAPNNTQSCVQTTNAANTQPCPAAELK